MSDQSLLNPSNRTGAWQTNGGLWEQLKPLAREMRHQSTEAEDKLWQALRRSQVSGLTFRRQHAIGPFIVDFYCAEHRLVIEIDGPIHMKAAEADRARDASMADLGLRVLRFKNEMVLSDLVAVIEQIQGATAGGVHA